MIKARFYDGETAEAHEVSVNYSGSFLSVNYMHNGFRKEHSFRISELSVQKDRDEVILTHKKEMIVMSLADWKWIAPPAIQSNKTLIIPALLFLAVLITGFLWHEEAIEATSTMIPDSLLAGVEKDMRKEFQKKNCLTEEQTRIVESVFIRLGKNRDEYEFYLIPSPVKNAFAAPGNMLIFHDALLKDLDSMEAFAGILAHEIAHQERHHIKKKIVKDLFVSWMFYAAMGDSGEFLKGLVSSRFNQFEEKEADVLAAKTLLDANIDPAGVRKFFLNRQKEEDQLLKYLTLSHPDYEDRIKIFTFASKTFGPMRKEDWKVLNKGCHSNL